jgi:hypothetical protein
LVAAARFGGIARKKAGGKKTERVDGRKRKKKKKKKKRIRWRGPAKNLSGGLVVVVETRPGEKRKARGKTGSGATVFKVGEGWRKGLHGGVKRSVFVLRRTEKKKKKKKKKKKMEIEQSRGKKKKKKKL